MVSIKRTRLFVSRVGVGAVRRPLCLTNRIPICRSPPRYSRAWWWCARGPHGQESATLHKCIGDLDLKTKWEIREGTTRARSVPYLGFRLILTGVWPPLTQCLLRAFSCEAREPDCAIKRTLLSSSLLDFFSKWIKRTTRFPLIGGGFVLVRS